MDYEKLAQRLSRAIATTVQDESKIIEAARNVLGQGSAAWLQPIAQALKLVNGVAPTPVVEQTYKILTGYFKQDGAEDFKLMRVKDFVRVLAPNDNKLRDKVNRIIRDVSKLLPQPARMGEEISNLPNLLQQRIPDVDPKETTSAKPHILPEQTWNFVTDSTLKMMLVRDYEELSRLVSVQAHKSIMIMCGSILEGVLHDLLKQRQEDADDAYYELYLRTKGHANDQAPSLDKWEFEHLIGVTDYLKLVDHNFKRVGDTMRDFRNLVHPRVETKKGAVVDPETAAAMLEFLKRTLRLLSEKATTS